ncbi:MAG TPA: hypothetical protein VMG09_00115 [Bacteroidota bacterium]|nr:hypothetical protein [Bacteroidota bacterium]
MKHVSMLFVAVIMAISLSHAQDPTGKWKTHMETPNGPMDMMFTFKTGGDTLSGQVEGPWGSMPIINGKNNGKEFSFDVSFGDMTMNHRCVMMGDSIAMKVPGMQGDTMNMVLKRVLETK